MTRIRQNNILYEWTYILDTYSNKIISHHFSTREGDKTPYYQCRKWELQQIIHESINGWIKAEIRCDYTKADKVNFPVFLDKYVQYFNNERPAYALGYLII